MPQLLSLELAFGDRPNLTRMAALAGSVWGHSASAASWVPTRKLVVTFMGLDSFIFLGWFFPQNQGGGCVVRALFLGQ